jgi:hypothetical protein
VAGAERRDPAKAFDVDVDELARMATLIAVRRLERVEPARARIRHDVTSRTENRERVTASVAAAR